jgi:phenylacetic acid degradation operon negative regulatory protein
VLRPKSVILDLLSPRGSRPMTAAAIVEACALFGISSNSARVTLARLCADGRLDRVGPGTYALSPTAEVLNRHVRGWARLDELVRPWNGGWLMVHLPRPLRSAARGRAERALKMARLALAMPTLAVRPDNLCIEPAELCASLLDFGLAQRIFISRGEVADREVAGRWARELWPVRKMRSDYARLATRIAHSHKQLAATPFERALAETFILGGEAIRALVLDPLLPAEIVPGAGRARLLAAMLAYDRAGRALWRRFNARFEPAARIDFAPFQTAALAANENA